MSTYPTGDPELQDNNLGVFEELAITQKDAEEASQAEGDIASTTSETEKAK